jgi:hypothetical protein
MKLLYVTGTALVAARTALARPAAPLLSQIVRAAPGLAAAACSQALLSANSPREAWDSSTTKQSRAAIWVFTLRLVSWLLHQIPKKADYVMSRHAEWLLEKVESLKESVKNLRFENYLIGFYVALFSLMCDKFCGSGFGDFIVIRALSSVPWWGLCYLVLEAVFNPSIWSGVMGFCVLAAAAKILFYGTSLSAPALTETAETAEPTLAPDERDAEIARLRAENARLRAGREGSEPPTPPPFRQVDAASQASPEDLMRFSPQTEDEGAEETKAGPIESESNSGFDSDSQPLLGGSPTCSPS